MIFKKIFDKWLIRLIVRKSLQCLALGFLGSAINVDLRLLSIEDSGIFFF